MAESLRVAGLFAGIGGIEQGFREAGLETVLLCEIDEAAVAVLEERFPEVPVAADVRRIRALPDADVVAAGFPCQDLSQAGRTAGIEGRNSGLVGQVFRLLDGIKAEPRWVVLENVPFMLQLDRGSAMRFLTSQLEERGFSWAYRVVDARAFGLPQRRLRVLLVASRVDDPRRVVFADESGERAVERTKDTACGFYWTEGVRGLGWAVDAVPTLKGGSTVGIPSPPGVWFPAEDDLIATPSLEDGERLQGFDEHWTLPAQTTAGRRKGYRWRLVGNAVSVPMARWLGARLAVPGEYDRARDDLILATGDSWPKAAWSHEGETWTVGISAWPMHEPYQSLADFLDPHRTPLSARAARGFLNRTRMSNLRFESDFLQAVSDHLQRMEKDAVLADAA